MTTGPKAGGTDRGEGTGVQSQPREWRFWWWESRAWLSEEELGGNLRRNIPGRGLPKRGEGRKQGSKHSSTSSTTGRRGG